jgi:hypothetical protein
VAAYLTVTEFKLRTIVPPTWVNDLETEQPGWLDAQLKQWSRWIDSRLRKRYAVPFDLTISSETASECVKNWLARLVTPVFLHRRGFRAADDETVKRVGEDEVETRAEIKEASDSVTGLFDLPLAGSSGKSAISKGGPHSYSEQSPYVWMDGQAETGSNEDMNRRGSGG